MSVAKVTSASLNSAEASLLDKGDESKPSVPDMLDMSWLPQAPSVNVPATTRSWQSGASYARFNLLFSGCSTWFVALETSHKLLALEGRRPFVGLAPR